MRKLLPRTLFLFGGLVVGLVVGLLLPAAQRLRLSQQLAAGIGRVVEQMPDGWPWRGMLSGVLQTLERNVEMLVLAQQQASVEGSWSLQSPYFGAELRRSVRAPAQLPYAHSILADRSQHPFFGGFKLPRCITPASIRLEDRAEAEELRQLVESGQLQMLAACRFVSLSHSPSLKSAVNPLNRTFGWWH